MTVYSWLCEQLGITGSVTNEYIQCILVISSSILACSVVLLFCSVLVGIVSNTFRR